MIENLKKLIERIKKVNEETFKTTDKLDYRKIYHDRIEEFSGKKHDHIE